MRGSVQRSYLQCQVFGDDSSFSTLLQALRVWRRKLLNLINCRRSISAAPERRFGASLFMDALDCISNMHCWGGKICGSETLLPKISSEEKLLRPRIISSLASKYFPKLLRFSNLTEISQIWPFLYITYKKYSYLTNVGISCPLVWLWWVGSKPIFGYIWAILSGPGNKNLPSGSVAPDSNLQSLWKLATIYTKSLTKERDTNQHHRRCNMQRTRHHKKLKDLGIITDLLVR